MTQWITSPEVSRVIPSSQTAHRPRVSAWGVTSGSQSGYDFTATLPPPLTFPGPVPFFSLGTFTHRNFVVSSPSLTSVQLDVVLVLSVDGVQTGPLNFTFTFNHVETPNNRDAMSLSDTARRRVYGPCDYCLLTHAHDVHR